MVEGSFNYPVLKQGQLVIDLKCRKVTIDDKIIDLCGMKNLLIARIL